MSRRAGRVPFALRAAAVTWTVCLALLFGTACGGAQPGSPEEEALPFRTLARSAPGGDGPEYAVVLVATDAEGLATINRLLSPRDRVRAAEVQISIEVVVGVFAGTVATGGRTLAVDELVVAGERVRIRSTLSVPAPDAVGTQAFTHPYQVISLSRDALPTPLRGSWVIRKEGGSVIASGELP